jgi:hypothetical protein
MQQIHGSNESTDQQWNPMITKLELLLGVTNAFFQLLHQRQGGALRFYCFKKIALWRKRSSEQTAC